MRNDFNFLPNRGNTRRQRSRAVKIWFGIGLVAALVMGYRYQQLSTAVQKLELESVSLQRNVTPVRYLRTEIKRLTNTVPQTMETESIDFANRYPVIGLLATVGQSINENVCITDLEVARKNSRHQVTLSGIGTNNIEIAKFAAMLRKSNRFSDVVLGSKASKTNGRARQYEIKCSY